MVMEFIAGKTLQRLTDLVLRFMPAATMD